MAWLVVMIVVFWMLSFKPNFSLSSFTFIRRLFSSYLLSAIRMVSSAYLIFIDISPNNLDSSLFFIQPGLSHDVLCIYVKEAEWQHTALMYSFPNLEPVCCSMLFHASWPSYRFLRRQVRWSGTPNLEEFSVSCDFILFLKSCYTYFLFTFWYLLCHIT